MPYRGLMKVFCIFGFLSFFVHGHAKPDQSQPTEKNQFTFSWPFNPSSEMKPRGGSTKGPSVTLDKQPNSEWLAKSEKGLSKFEMDRRSILAMQGAYRVTFDFVETMNFTPPFKPARPYQSWGTEYVYVVEDKKDFISLQHIMVMFFLEPSDDGQKQKVSKPMVMKHWRQDWQFEDRDLNVFTGFNTWKKESFSMKDVDGTWSQAVYQVDDSPRYQSVGFWSHESNFSSWQSRETWRPLPRREFSVRSDYDVLLGTNEHIITPQGWVQEEENLKVKLKSPGNIAEIDAVVAKEVGVARYERILGHDWSGGDEYWKKTSGFWAAVRDIWSELLAKNENLIMKKSDYSAPLFQEMFQMASDPTMQSNINASKKSIILEKISEYVASNS